MWGGFSAPKLEQIIYNFFKQISIASEHFELFLYVVKMEMQVVFLFLIYQWYFIFLNWKISIFEELNLLYSINWMNCMWMHVDEV